MRRVGKSSLLHIIAESFRSQGIPEDRILVFEELRSYRPFYDRVKASLRSGNGKIYLFVDEVQEIEGWGKAISSLFAEGEYDIYLTGSNAKLLSGELATLLAGRAIAIPVWPLSLPEFASFRAAAGRPSLSDDELFDLYARYGGLPGVHLFRDRAQGRAPAREDPRSRPPRKSRGLRLRQCRLASLVQEDRRLSSLRPQERLGRHDSLLPYGPARRPPSLRSRTLRPQRQKRLALLEKYYAGDLGLRHALLGYREGDRSGVVENLVYLELRRRGYSVYVGKIGELEIDFIAEGPKGRAYVQVAYLFESQATIDRELAPFKLVDDKYDCYILSLDRHFGSDLGGVHRLNVIDFLLGARIFA